ncbi:hypothetical protein CLNEO_06220 [Anaerotignum neopropionicum]|uniref:Uncharacterized protein n=1 Tax=Anaerotignum neopropionicum TaxID=36847 RepID=A0A136WJ38_9FIRM|nr:hypothetical protein CLNEO_06220 [Anaerotignum neopropionicum]
MKESLNKVFLFYEILKLQDYACEHLLGGTLGVTNKNLQIFDSLRLVPMD